MVDRPRGLIVAIDGPAGAGKSTVAKLLAARLGYALLDTGAIYRSMALRARERGIGWDDGPGVAALADGIDIAFRMDETINHVTLNGQDVTAAIRTPEISDGASRVSALPEVRRALLGLQRRIGAGGGVVVEGRDIGTVVFPDAEAKFFLTANTDERARRRVAELAAAGKPVDAAQTKAEIVARDTRDSTRAAAPLRKADDAIEIDSSAMSPDAVVAMMADVVAQRSR
jgi:cytidylate kinase